MNNDYVPARLGFDWDQVPGLSPPAADGPSGCTVFDLWGRKSLGKVSGKGFKTAQPVPSRDSVFLTLSGCV